VYNAATVKETIGRYRVARKLGEGGMGVVYAARDERLQRDVAIKLLRDASAFGGRDRVWREARAAAAVSHPNVCHVYEVGEEEDVIYIVMEMLDGEPLSGRLLRGALPLRDAVPVALGILAALEALHARGIVHRDLKPANVFLTPHGIKLLDFGLAHGLSPDATRTDVELTSTGVVAGTPAYMAPEQLKGRVATMASDQFAFGTILFEMLTGRTPFAGDTVWDVTHAILHDRPASLTGGGVMAALGAVIRRCLQKEPADRYPDPAAIAREVRAAAEMRDSGVVPVARPATRLMVLPFRLLRPDPEIDFLSFSLADSLVVSLTGLGPLVVRSSHAAQTLAGEALDLKRIASEGEVDAVLTGSILRAGEQVRLVAQLVETPGGAILWSKTAQVRMQDVFQLQDDLAKQIIDSLAIPLSASDRVRLDRDVPASGRAFELYLRANHLAHATVQPARLLAARELYRACLDDDPAYAPAWARLGRVYRVLGKFGAADGAEAMRQAQEAFDRAFALGPDLPLAHSLFTPFEIEELGRPEAAMTRLLRCARHSPNAPDLFDGLVIACRYCGLLPASVAAAKRVRELDPAVQTSVQYAYLYLNEPDNALQFDHEDGAYVSALVELQRGNDGAAAKHIAAAIRPTPILMLFASAIEAAAAGRFDQAVEHTRQIHALGFRDPEGLLMGALLMARAGAHDDALDTIERVIEARFIPPMRALPWFASLTGHERFERLMAKAEDGRRRAAAAFRAAGGESLLGVTVE
jgi:serine/threonine protein kinase/tetratricopeptide (TPR) repeat protein